MRMVIAVFEDIPFLALNLFILYTQPELSGNTIFMGSFILSIFVLGYKVSSAHCARLCVVGNLLLLWLKSEFVHEVKIRTE